MVAKIIVRVIHIESIVYSYLKKIILIILLFMGTVRLRCHALDRLMAKI